MLAAKKAIRKKWGLTPANIKWLYTMVIRPKISYGAVAWGTNLSTRNTKQTAKPSTTPDIYTNNKCSQKHRTRGT